MFLPWRRAVLDRIASPNFLSQFELHSLPAERAHASACGCAAARALRHDDALRQDLP